MASAGSSVGGVDRVLGTEVLGKLKLLVDDVDGHDRGPGDLGVLQGHVPEPADSEHGHEVRQPHARNLHSLVGRDAGAGQQGGVERVDALRDLADVGGRAEHVLGVAAIDGVAGVALAEAQRLPTRRAVLALTAHPGPAKGRRTRSPSATRVTPGPLALRCRRLRARG